MKKGRFEATIRPASDEQQNRLFSEIAEAIGAGIGQIAHEVMPDIRSKLIDEAWFSRPGASHDLTERPDIWRSEPVKIEGQWHARDDDDLTQDR